MEEIDGMNCIISETNIHIENSYTKNKRSKIKKILLDIKELHPECKVFEERCFCNLISEWRAHNRFCRIGYKTEETCSVDLDTNEPFWHRFLYTIIGI